ncbi:MAG: AAA family ATPase [Gammaproteobacteria bacterium]|nr:AAA family ATPase [Gammaproteobacteria bacterium]
MLGNILPTPFILSAERFGISLFYRELDFTKNQLVDLLQKIGDQKNNENYSPFLFIDRTTSRYALPIKDNIDYTRNIADHKKDKSDLYSSKVFGDIEAMMAGNYKIVDDEIRFMSKPRDGEKRFNIPLHLASSSVRGLSDLYFYLRHIANNNQLLIIDEPESHLDTNNQVQLARLLARLVNSGVKVLITTHSDYLIKEINNLIMLDHDFEGKDKVRRKLKYKKEDSLNKNCVSAYIATTKGLTSCAVDKYGIEMPVFDETIDRINTVSNELASRI